MSITICALPSSCSLFIPSLSSGNFPVLCFPVGSLELTTPSLYLHCSWLCHPIPAPPLSPLLTGLHVPWPLLSLPCYKAWPLPWRGLAELAPLPFLSLTCFCLPSNKPERIKATWVFSCLSSGRFDYTIQDSCWALFLGATLRDEGPGPPQTKFRRNLKCSLAIGWDSAKLSRSVSEEQICGKILSKLITFYWILHNLLFDTCWSLFPISKFF